MSERIQFELPNDLWEAVEPESGQVFSVVRLGEYPYFRPNIGADLAELQPDAPLEGAIDSVAKRLSLLDESAHVVRRSVDEATGTALQQVDLDVELVPGVRRSLSQAQTFLVLEDENSDRRMLLCVMLTAESSVLADYLDDYQSVIENVRAV